MTLIEKMQATFAAAVGTAVDLLSNLQAANAAMQAKTFTAAPDLRGVRDRINRAGESGGHSAIVSVLPQQTDADPGKVAGRYYALDKATVLVADPRLAAIPEQLVATLAAGILSAIFPPFVTREGSKTKRTKDARLKACMDALHLRLVKDAQIPHFTAEENTPAADWITRECKSIEAVSQAVSFVAQSVAGEEPQRMRVFICNGATHPALLWRVAGETAKLFTGDGAYATCNVCKLPLVEKIGKSADSAPAVPVGCTFNPPEVPAEAAAQ